MTPAAPARASRPARWRSPAGWPLRTRIVATMIALLAVLGLVVGGTAELYLYKSLHQQIDADLADLEKRIGGPGINKGRDNQLLSSSLSGRPTGGMTLKSIVVVVPAEGDPVGGKVLPDEVLEFLQVKALHFDSNPRWSLFMPPSQRSGSLARKR